MLQLCIFPFFAKGNSAVVEVQELEILALDHGVKMVGSECILESLHSADFGVSLAEGANYLFPVFFDTIKALFAEQMVSFADQHGIVFFIAEAQEAYLALVLEKLLGLPEGEC